MDICESAPGNSAAVRCTGERDLSTGRHLGSFSGVPHRGGTQDTDFDKGFTKGIFTKKYSAKKWGGQGDPDPLMDLKVLSRFC